MQKFIAHHPESDDTFGHRGLSGADWDQGVDEVEAEFLPAGTQIHNLGPDVSTVLPSIDFETYSAAGFKICKHTGKVSGVGSNGKGGLPIIGTPNYAAHDSTEILCMYYNMKDGRGVRPWVPGMPHPEELFEHIRRGGLVEAFNVTFEFWIWNMVGARRSGWPALPLEQCRCVMARSRRFNLPGALGNLAKALGTAPKDSNGSVLLRKLSRPHTPTKKRQAIRWTVATAWDDFVKLYNYCEDDVRAEDDAAALIPDLSPEELATWQLDQLVNVRGVLVDMPALRAMLKLMDDMHKKFTLELVSLTGGRVGSVSEVAKFVEWLGEQGVHIPDLTADTVEATLANYKKVDPPPGLRDAVRALEIRAILGGANIKKLPTLSLQVSNDGRLRDQYKYCGADRTGRWAAGGVQLQNMTAKGPKSMTCTNCSRIVGPDCSAGIMGGCPECGGNTFKQNDDWTVEAVECALYDVQNYDLDTVTKIWGDPGTLLAGCLRGLFIAKAGHRFICVDFSAIEAVVVACLALCQWRIDVFNTHGKIYEQSAANATGVPFEEILEHKKLHGFHHPFRKGIGKIRELAGGFGGWIGAWYNFGAEDYYDDDNAIKQDIIKWRDESPEIVQMWGGQFIQTGPKPWNATPGLYGLEGMFIESVLNPGKLCKYNEVSYVTKDDTTFCRLPSGRYIQYHNPRLVPCEDKLKRGPAVKILFDGNNTNSKKGPIGWHTMETYGGMLFENVVQAVARDLQAEALKRVEAAGYPVVMHTHDEIIAEVPEGVGSVKEMADLMCERPAWASWWPIRADGWEHKRYQKD